MSTVALTGALPVAPWTVLPAALLWVALVASLVRKTTGSSASIGLRDALGVPPRRWLGIGVLEGCAVLGLMVGLIRPTVGVAAAYGTALLMLGAIIAHLRVGLAGRRLLAPTVLLASALAAGLGFSAAL